MKEKCSNPAYYPAYYLPDTPSEIRQELQRKDDEEFRSWILGLNESYDMILELHDSSVPKQMREYLHRELGSGLHGYVTNDGHTAIIEKREPDKEFASILLSSSSHYDLSAALESYRSKQAERLRVDTINEPLFLTQIGKVEGGFEFYPYRVRKLRPLEFYTYPVETGANLVTGLIQHLRSDL